ncbi:MAG: carbohydrate ABC transporter permease [Fimbriimonas sp.]|nr:carbohydrate ABC transporter permease [Fimbriimonas sp.]
MSVPDQSTRYAQSARKGRATERFGKGALIVVLICGALLFLLPLYIMLAISLKTNAEIGNSSMWAWPHQPTWDNYRVVLTDPDLNFIRKFFNTLFLAAVPTLASVVTAAMVAFPFARLQFRGRDRFFVILLSTMMLPGVVTMIPGYVLYAKLGWINTYKPFLIPAFFGGGAFSIFLIRQFMLAIPREMDEAAKIDGATNSTIFWRLILPNCAPVLATLGVLGFVGGFKDLIGPLLMLNDPDLMTLEVGLRSLQQAHKTDFGLLMAGSMVVLIPIFAIFAVGQKYFARGITLTGGK